MFSFTPEEKRVILFFSCAALFGLAVTFALKRIPLVQKCPLFAQESGRLELNRADKDSLLSVPGIGEKLAERILEYRRLRGGFRGIEELREIKGITAKRLEKLKESFYLQ
jgi:competence ComEA-like helix-hairpin-helix protein